jgi:glycosyltransferase involved in cell wall biosynthesis
MRSNERIGIDARLLYQTGIGVYLRNLIYYLSKKTLEGVTFVVFARPTDIVRFLSENPHIKTQSSCVFESSSVMWHSFGEQTKFLAQVTLARLDLMHFPYFSWPVLYTGKFVATIHDITPLRIKTGNLSTRGLFLYGLKHAAFRFAFWQQIARAVYVMTPTHAVARELGGKKKIIVTPEGLSFEFLQAQAEEVPTARPYLLYVGNFYPHKNVHTLIQAWNELKTGDAELIMAGPDNSFARKLRALTREIPGIRYVLGATTGKLKYLYQHALALVNPSQSEGFGLPLVEAMSFGCPLILSDIPVFQEVAGAQGNYFRITDTEALKTLIKKAIARELVQTKLDRETFSFEKMTNQALAVYKNALYE